jgi:hypothetical protein
MRRAGPVVAVLVAWLARGSKWVVPTTFELVINARAAEALGIRLSLAADPRRRGAPMTGEPRRRWTSS